MAVFLVNTCKFNGCGITFPTLQELIRHIEDTHLNFDPQASEQRLNSQPSCLPISYVVRAFNGGLYQTSGKKELTGSNFNQLKNKNMRSHSPALSITSTTPTGSEMDEENFASESEDSWSNVSNEGENSILKMLNPAAVVASEEQGKPYACYVEGCKKRYRNANGLKYHYKSVHPNQIRPKKESHDGQLRIFKCECGKIYKTPYGLKNHLSTHSNAKIDYKSNKMDSIPKTCSIHFSSVSSLIDTVNINRTQESTIIPCLSKDNLKKSLSLEKKSISSKESNPNLKLKEKIDENSITAMDVSSNFASTSFESSSFQTIVEDS